MKMDSYGMPLAFKPQRIEPCMNARFIRAKSNPETLGVLVYGDIGLDVDGSLFEDLMSRSAPFESIEIRINSLGGDAWTGIAIYNLLSACGYPITAYVDGVAASAASIIAMAASEVVVYPSSSIMIHDATGVAFGNAAAMRDAAERVDEMTSTMTDIYVAVTGRKRAEVRAAMEAESYFKGRSAVEFGLATKFETKQTRGRKTVASAKRWLEATAEPWQQASGEHLKGDELRDALVGARGPSTLD